MTQFKDFDDLYDPLVLPIHGKNYTIPELSFDAGARVNGIIAGDEELLDEDFFRAILGTSFEEMRSDGVSAKAITRAGKAALADFKYGRAVALSLWETDGDPKALAEYQKRNAPNRASRRSKSTGAARKTQ